MLIRALNIKVFVVTLLVCSSLAIGHTVEAPLWGNHQGYAPEQPIHFSHRLHAGDLGIDCVYCHYGARESRTAGIPPASLCMNCHKNVTAGFDVIAAERAAAAAEGREPRRIVSPELAKLYAALGLDESGAAAAPGADGGTAKPIAWVRVHNLPDFVAFDHSVHVAGGVACQTCHGPVQTFERMKQHANLSMGWCLDCHRKTPVHLEGGATRMPTTDCAACHY